DQHGRQIDVPGVVRAEEGHRREDRAHAAEGVADGEEIRQVKGADHREVLLHPYQLDVSPGFGIRIDRGSSSRRATSAAIRRGGSSYGSRPSANVPQWIPMNLVDRRSREACSASSGDMWTGRA